MERIREILLTQYIGAIVIAMLLTEALGGVVSVLVEPVIWYQQASRLRSAMEPGLKPFPWSDLLPLGIRILLYAFVAYLLLSWLYRNERTSPADEEENLAKTEA